MHKPQTAGLKTSGTSGSALLCLLLAALLAGCAGRRNAPGFYEDYSGKRKEVSASFKQLVEGTGPQKSAAVDKLAAMLETGGDDALAVKHFAFRPRRGMARVIIAVEKFPEGMAILGRAIPVMLPLLKTEQRGKIDTILRAVQGSSPRESSFEAWNSWWKRTGRKMFGTGETGT